MKMQIHIFFKAPAQYGDEWTQQNMQLQWVAHDDYLITPQLSITSADFKL
jgi:hypothetical protein